MNEIKITHELSAEDRKRIDDLLFAMGYLAGQIQQLHLAGPYKEDKDAVQATEKDLPKEDPLSTLPAEVKATEVPAEEHPVENPFPEAPQETETPAEPEAPAVTKDDVRKLFVKLAASGKKDQAREIVTAFASSITDLADEAVAQVYVKLAALGA